MTIDGQEMIGSTGLITSATLEFSKDDKESGDLKTTSVTVFGTDVTNTTYACGDESMTLTYSDGSTETYDMDLGKKDMVMTGTIDGSLVVMTSEKQ